MKEHRTDWPEFKICKCPLDSWEDIVVDHDEYFADRSTIYHHCADCSEDYAITDFYTGRILYLDPKLLRRYMPDVNRKIGLTSYRETDTNYFNTFLQLSNDELVWEIGDVVYFEPDEIDFLINPRRLRGSDFLMRWSQGRWSETVVINAINDTDELQVIPYGPSTIAPEDPQKLEIFFETIGIIEREGKRPDLLLYDKETYNWAYKEIVARIGDIEKNS
jgi:hypothetical protein